MPNKSWIAFDYSSSVKQDSLEVRTEKFNETLLRMSNGEGMMEDDVEPLCKFYNVPHPYE